MLKYKGYQGSHLDYLGRSSIKDSDIQMISFFRGFVAYRFRDLEVYSLRGLNNYMFIVLNI